MKRLIEDTLLRDKRYVFKDRKEAGMLLAQRLLGYKDTDGIVFAIPSVSRPRELPPQPLAKLDMKLSLHPASIKQTILISLVSNAQISMAALQRC